MHFIIAIVLPLSIILCAPQAPAGQADIVDVTVENVQNRTYRIGVTVRHADQGWNHYADRWEVLSADGDILATRVLLHPHVNEQPFTRWLPSVVLPEGTRKIVLRAHDSVHAYGGRVKEVPIPKP